MKPGDLLPFELSPLLSGLDDLVAEEALQLASHDDPRFERMARLVASEYEHRVMAYRYLGRIAADQDSVFSRVFAQED